MLKFKKKQVEAESSQGITTTGNALHRYWLMALLSILIPVLASFTYLLLLRENALQDNQILQVSKNTAEKQAANVDLLFHQFGERLKAAATSPLALAAISSRNPDDIALVEKALIDYFPGATSLRLITMGKLGTAGLEGSNLGLRNHIEVDLLRRTGEGEAAAPESYQFEGTWLTSLAERVQHPRQSGKSAVILATLDNRVVTTGRHAGQCQALQSGTRTPRHSSGAGGRSVWHTDRAGAWTR